MKSMNRMDQFFWLLLAGIIICTGNARAQAPRYDLVPYPLSLSAGSGEFVLTPNTTLVIDAGFESAAAGLQSLKRQAFGKTLKTTTAQTVRQIVLHKDAAITSNEGYHISITPQGIMLSAGEPAGMFRAVQTIRQLLPLSFEKKTAPVQSMRLPALTVTDEPVYSWRGIHLDVARHFFSKAYLEKLIDLMALYKLNKLHLHLTDERGLQRTDGKTGDEEYRRIAKLFCKKNGTVLSVERQKADRVGRNSGRRYQCHCQCNVLAKLGA